MGEDGPDGLCPAGRAALEEADLVFGSDRHLAMLPPLRGEVRVWPQPFRNALPHILAERGRKICVIATSDPFHYGIGAGLSRAISEDELEIIPQISSFAMACTRMRWAQEECALVSLHGRTLQRIVPLLQPDARILALAWDETSPAAVAKLLAERGMGASELTVMEVLGGPHERIRKTRADAFDLAEVHPLNLIAVSVKAPDATQMLPLTPGLEARWFENDGSLMPDDLRAITLAALQPRVGGLLWDVGAACGDVSAEWCLRHPSNRSIAFEAKEERGALATRNRIALGSLRVTVAGAAPAAFAEKESPDAVFIGGGIGDDGVVEGAFGALKSGGRLVANAATAEGKARLVALAGQYGGDLRSIAVDMLDAGGNPTSATAITQWRVTKG